MSSNIGGTSSPYDSFGAAGSSGAFPRSAESLFSSDPARFPLQQPFGSVQSSQQPHGTNTPTNNTNKAGYFEQLAGIGLGVTTLFTDTLFSHPCLVLRRQCQVHVDRSAQYHTTPFTLVPVVYNLQQNQGILCFWKGVLGSIVVKGVTYAIETIVGDMLGLPRSISRGSDGTKVWRHFLLKGFAYLVTTPFVVAAFVETVQSDVASERPGLFDCIRNGIGRLSHDIMGPRDSSRRIAMWLLVTPCVTYRILHYSLSSVAHYIMIVTVRKHLMRKNVCHRTVFDNYWPGLFAAFASHLAADAVLFPIETVLNRLYLQGTRAIIDNLDDGIAVIPFNSRYNGFVDCARTILSEEGYLGFYKGFGALALQYMLHFLMLRMTRGVLDTLEESFNNRPPPISAGIQAQAPFDRQSPPTVPPFH